MNDVRIYPEGNMHIVEATGVAHLANLPGVECINPQETVAEEKIYQKIFRRKPIYLPGQYQKAVAENLLGTDVVVIGMNGYSRLSDVQCKEYGVRPGAYEAACHAILTNTVVKLQQEFQGVDVRFVHGASNMGVDRVIINVARKLNRSQLGHSCPEYMFYVEDDEVPVYVAPNVEEYSKSFVRSLHILIAANGRAQSFEHDIDAAFKFQKHVVPVNVLKSISSNGGPPGINGEGKIEDAVAAMEQLIHMVTTQWVGKNPDPWKNLMENLHTTTVAITRQLISPQRAFA